MKKIDFDFTDLPPEIQAAITKRTPDTSYIVGNITQQVLLKEKELGTRPNIVLGVEGEFGIGRIAYKTTVDVLRVRINKF